MFDKDRFTFMAAIFLVQRPQPSAFAGPAPSRLMAIALAMDSRGAAR